MRIFCTPRNGENASLLVRALLKFSYTECFGNKMPEIIKTAAGKPYFASCSDIHFSLSHTDDFVLCAIGRHNIGADIQTIRQIKPEVPRRVCTQDELAEFDFFELWALKESVIKLFGKAPAEYRDISFSRKSGIIYCSVSGIYSRLYDSIPSCSIAACSFECDFPEHIEIVSTKNLHLST